MPIGEVGVCAECETLLQWNKKNLGEKLQKVDKNNKAL